MEHDACLTTMQPLNASPFGDARDSFCEYDPLAGTPWDTDWTRRSASIDISSLIYEPTRVRRSRLRESFARLQKPVERAPSRRKKLFSKMLSRLLVMRTSAFAY